MYINCNRYKALSKIEEDLKIGDELIKVKKPKISIFGSSRIVAGTKYYKLAEELAFEATKAGFMIVSGGGPGIMEAANRGAHLSNKISAGLGIGLPNEPINSYVSDEFSYNFNYLFTRKQVFISSSIAYIYFPGGLGTLDELFEIFLLMQLKKIPRRSIFLVGESFWGGLISWLKQVCEQMGTISNEDRKLLKLSSDPSQIISEIEKESI